MTRAEESPSRKASLQSRLAPAHQSETAQTVMNLNACNEEARHAGTEKCKPAPVIEESHSTDVIPWIARFRLDARSLPAGKVESSCSRITPVKKP
jgi:hypothetical protein